MIPSEFEIQAEVYVKLKKEFPIVRGEYFYEPIDRRSDKFGLIKAHRFDIVVFNEHQRILAVLEIKKGRGKHRISHYQKSVIAPVILVEGMSAVNSIVDRIRTEIAKYSPPPEVVQAANQYMLDMSAYTL